MYKNELLKIRSELMGLNEKLQLALLTAPEGKLRVSAKKGKYRYLHITTEPVPHISYIKAADIDLAKQLGRKDYYQRVQKVIAKNLSVLDHFLAAFDLGEIRQVYDQLCEGRRNLFPPVCDSDEEYAQKWLAVEYEGLGFGEDDPIYKADNGLRVRSKTEILIANMLIKKGIPFRYECPLKLPRSGIVYPDSTILIPWSRQVVYLEHCGMMDDEGYLRDFFRKLSKYSRNDIVQGKQLFTTFESKCNPIDMDVVEKLLDSIMSPD